MTRNKQFSILIIIILIPQTLLANAGSALIWMPVFQLIFGNILIGIVEGLAVTLIFKTKWYRSILFMLLGNYVSWIVGNGFILLFQEHFIETIFRLKGVFATWVFSMVILYFITVAIEAPFFNWIFTKENRIWNRSWKIAFILNIFTYLAMILIYLNVSKYNFFTDLNINQSLLNKDLRYELILKKNKKLYKGNLSGSYKGDVIYIIPEKYNDLHLILVYNPSNGTADLTLSNYKSDTLLIQKSFVDSNSKINYLYLNEKELSDNIDFRDSTSRKWQAYHGGWAIEGLTISYEDETEDNYAFEVPWMFWNFSQITFLNENELICLFHGRLILLNIQTKEIAFITKAEDYILRSIREK